VDQIRRATGRSNVEHFDDLGLTGDDVVLAHGVHLSPEEVRLLAKTDTRICHCPGTNLKLASGIADVPLLIENGVSVVLGSDGAPCNNRLSMFHEMTLAATLHSLRHGPRAMSADTVLQMATHGGASALHLDHVIGTIEQGKAADVVVIGLDAWSLLPGGELPSRVVYGATAGDVRHVVVDGSPVVEAGQLTTVSGEEVRQGARQAWRATRARMDERAHH
jgi:cytosine/adenosine deaminase-related metal-dependent hydrolase